MVSVDRQGHCKRGGVIVNMMGYVWALHGHCRQTGSLSTWEAHCRPDGVCTDMTWSL